MEFAFAALILIALLAGVIGVVASLITAAQPDVKPQAPPTEDPKAPSR